MKDYQLTKNNLESFFHDIQAELDGTPVVIVSTQDAGTGKWGMAKLWRSWIGKVADVMAGRGSTMPLVIKANGEHHGSRPFNASDAHELFTASFLGVDGEGYRLSWSKKSHDGMRAATKGERFIALRKLEMFCLEKGIPVFKPRDSEYSKLEEEQES